MNEVEQMSSTPTPSFPRKREPSVFGAGFRRTGSASHWVDQLTLLKCASAFAGMTVGRILGMLILLSSAPALAQQVIGEPRLLDGFEDATPWRVVTSNQVSGELRVADGAEIGSASGRERGCQYV